MGDAFIEVASFGQEKPEIAFRHPGIWVSRNGGPPNCFDIRILPALLPRQHGTGQKWDRVNEGPKNCRPWSEGIDRDSYSGADQGERTDAGKILEVIGDKRVDERIDVDETESREKQTAKNKSSCKWHPRCFSQ